jgi:hypothetical protein
MAGAEVLVGITFPTRYHSFVVMNLASEVRTYRIECYETIGQMNENGRAGFVWVFKQQAGVDGDIAGIRNPHSRIS